MSFLVLGIGIGIVMAMIIVLDVHPFLALILATMTVGILSPMPLEPEGLGAQAVRAVELTAQGFGTTAGSIGIVIVLAAIIGQCLLESGAADRIVRSFLDLLGSRRAGFALMGSGYVLSIPVFFDTVFFLLVPLARSLRLRTGKCYALYVSAICAGALVTHSLVPPTPGPLFMADALELPLGTAIVGGFLLGLGPALFGLVVSGWVDRRLDIPLRDVPGTDMKELELIAGRDASALPGLVVSLLPVVVPVGLISIHSILDAAAQTVDRPLLEALLAWSGFFGDKNIALLAGSFLAAWLLRRSQSLSVKGLGQKLEPAIASAGVIILITSAGGAFGQMLSRIGIDESLSRISWMSGGLGVLIVAWAIAAVMKIAQGSGTVAMITASAIVAAMVPDHAALEFHVIYLFAAIGFGSAFFSWMNDSGFWVVSRMGGLTESETLRTWTFVVASIGVFGLVQILALASLFPLK